MNLTCMEKETQQKGREHLSMQAVMNVTSKLNPISTGCVTQNYSTFIFPPICDLLYKKQFQLKRQFLNRLLIIENK